MLLGRHERGIHVVGLGTDGVRATEVRFPRLAAVLARDGAASAAALVKVSRPRQAAGGHRGDRRGPPRCGRRGSWPDRSV